VSVFLPADLGEVQGLHAYLSRLVALDGRACVRLQGQRHVLGVWGGPPMDVVTMRPVALGEPSDAADLTVSALRLLERLAPQQAAGVRVELPPAVPGPAWAGLLPPRSGWTAVATVPAAAVHDAVRVGVAAFARRVALLAEVERTRSRLDAVAAEVWGRPVAGGVPLRVAHAAHLTGLLGREGDVTAYTCGPWRRLGCPGGSVASRGGAAGALDLFALRATL
jgi:hypothetical protein